MVSQSGLQSWDRLCNLTGEQLFVTDWDVLHRTAGQRGGSEGAGSIFRHGAGVNGLPGVWAPHQLHKQVVA